MKVGLFTDCYLPTLNGVATSVAALRTGLERRGHDVTIVAPAHPGLSERDPGVVRVASVSALPSVGIRWALPCSRLLDALCARSRFDVVHTHTEFPLAWAVRRVARRQGIPMVHTAHTAYEHYRHYAPLGPLLPHSAIRAGWRRLLEPYCLVVCPSAKTRCYFQDLVPGLRAAVVPNGIDLERFDSVPLRAGILAAVRRDLGIPRDARVILYVGRIAAEKRSFELLGAVCGILAGMANTVLVMAGAGRGLARARGLARRDDLRGRLVLPGSVTPERLPALYATASLFVTASLSENHPMTIIEAAAAGLPIVARRDESLDGLVTDGVNGFLADRDVDIGRHLVRILSDETLRSRMSVESRAASRSFSAERHAERMEHVYEQTLRDVAVRGKFFVRDLQLAVDVDAVGAQP